jgi:hypothetical protein
MNMKATFTIALVAGVFLLPQAYAQEAPCTVDREEVVKALEEGVSQDELSAKLEGCIAADSVGSAGKEVAVSLNAIGQKIKDTGSVFYEALTSCGYHPQRKELTCPIEIRQPFGFGGAPALQPAGSYEYVLFCVNTGVGLIPVNVNGVHVHDEVFGASPNWYMSAVVPANGALFSMPLQGQTLRARAILSWAVPPAGCNAVPVWGNQADFRIRLDP